MTLRYVLGSLGARDEYDSCLSHLLTFNWRCLCEERPGHESPRHLHGYAGEHVSDRVGVGSQGMARISRCNLDPYGPSAVLSRELAVERRDPVTPPHWWLVIWRHGPRSPSALGGQEGMRAIQIPHCDCDCDCSSRNAEAWTAPTGTGRCMWFPP